MTRDDFNRTAQDKVCACTIHLKKDAFGQADVRDQVATFALAVDAWALTQESSIRSGILAVTRHEDNTVTVIGTGHALTKLDEAFAKEIRYTGIEEYTPAIATPLQMKRRAPAKAGA